MIEIPTPAWFDQYEKTKHNNKRQLKTLKRDNKFAKIGELPVISVPNMRSIFPKLNNFITDMHMRNISIALCSETWHKEDKKKHKNEIERLLNMEGLKFLSTPRPPGKRGGGCAIIADLSHYTLDRLEISNENKLEICWGILRPKNANNCNFKKYIVAAFYCPPNSRKKEKLITHIITNCHMLLTKYPRCGLFIGGDKNSLNLAPILQGLPKCQHVVSGNTHKDKCLDVLITNIPNLYKPPLIVPAVQPDNPAQAKPSDHLVPVIYPISGVSGSVSRSYSTKITQPLPDSAIRNFGEWLTNEKWAVISETDGPDLMLHKFNNTIKSKIDFYFPKKSVKLSNEDLPFIDWKLKNIKRKLNQGRTKNQAQIQTKQTGIETKPARRIKKIIQRNKNQRSTGYL